MLTPTVHIFFDKTAHKVVFLTHNCNVTPGIASLTIEALIML